MATGEVEAMYFLLNYTLNLSYIYLIFSSQKIVFSYLILVISGLENWTLNYVTCCGRLIVIVFYEVISVYSETCLNQTSWDKLR
jgi:hypothetical protein